MENFLLDIGITQDVKNYIREHWSFLRRSHRHIFASIADPKLPKEASRAKFIYISRKENSQKVHEELSAALPLEQLNQIQIKHLPTDPHMIRQQGWLYLPHDYIVPGGRFNEMYGWDSFFIIQGLLIDGEVELAKNIVDNAVYQVKYYGKLLNANRSYQLDRSHPPLLTQMIFSVYKKIGDKDWLNEIRDECCNYYHFWTSSAHAIPDIDLCRYYAKSVRPAPEVIYSELDHLGRNHYQRAAAYYRAHRIQAYDVTRYYNSREDYLRPLFYRADRSARESGFDPSSRYGPLNADIIYHAPICLNTLLYQMELDLAKIHLLLGMGQEANKWREQAMHRAAVINYYCWDEDLGYYFDYNFVLGRTRPYIFATTFYPLWAGIASRVQARRIVHNLSVLEAPGGLLTSAYVTGNQWDAPFGWAPLHFFAVHGLMRYGYKREACRLANKFLNLVNDEFAKYQLVYEKYDVSRKTAHVQSLLKFGYESNEVGFGWTNAVYLDLLKLHALPI